MAQREGCARGGVKILDEAAAAQIEATETTAQKEPVMSVMPGKKAPDFEAPAYHKGQFTNIKLSDHQGKWRLLCFYPGDFTFV